MRQGHLKMVPGQTIRPPGGGGVRKSQGKEKRQRHDRKQSEGERRADTETVRPKESSAVPLSKKRK